MCNFPQLDFGFYLSGPDSGGCISCLNCSFSSSVSSIGGVEAIEGAKKPETRARRIDAAVRMLAKSTRSQRGKRQ